MHFRLQIKRFMVQSLTLKSVISIINKRKRLKEIQLTEIKGKTPEGWLFRVKKENKNMSKKKHQIWDYLQFRCCINQPCVQRSADLIYRGSFIIPLSQRCQLVFVPRGGIKVFLSRVAANYLVTLRKWKLFCQIVTSDVRSHIRAAAVPRRRPRKRWSMRRLSFNQGATT